MGIKKERLFRLANKVLPFKAKKLLVKHNIVKGSDDIRSLVYKDADVVEFWLKNFNASNRSGGLIKPFKHIVNIYNRYLKDDPNWHFIYEGESTVLRCSYKYAKNVEKYLKDNYIERSSMGWWKEGTHVTTVYKDEFREIFHWSSVLAMKMAKNEENDFYISQSADRMVHVFLLQSIYLAEINGNLDRLREADYGVGYWEAEHMAALTRFRSYHIGTIDGHNKLKAHWDKIYRENEERKCLDSNGQ